MTMLRAWFLGILAGAAAAYAQGTFKAPHPLVEKIVAQVSDERIAATMKKLETFGTRDIHSTKQDPAQGIGAAQRWIEAELKSYSPRLEVTLDSHPIKKRGRVLADLEVTNVIAKLPGKTQPDVHVIIMGHYDSVVVQRRAPGAPVPPEADRLKTAATTTAPGVSDNASGVAALMELARVMSQFEFDKTILFIATSGEEYGLYGATGFATNAKKNGLKIEAVLNNDIIGNDDNGQGLRISNRVNLFSDDPNDSPSRTLARYVRESAARYVPEMEVNVVFRPDRFGRGGDHTPFNTNGFAGVRFTTAAEDLLKQHTPKDTFEFVSPAYCARVTRVNGAALASLALAPKPPQVMRDITTEEAARGMTSQVNLTRGAKNTDAVLKWKSNAPETDLAGYSVVIRPTTAPYWERELFVGKVNEYTLKNLSIDDVVIGIKAIDQDGVESLVSAYTLPRRNFAPAN